MGNRGRFKYICEDCSADNWSPARERISRFKSHCIECGSPYLVHSKRSIGSEKISDWNKVKNEQRENIEKKMNK